MTEHLEKIRVVSTSSTTTGGSAPNANVDPLGKMFTSNSDQPSEPPVFHVQPFLLEVSINRTCNWRKKRAICGKMKSRNVNIKQSN